MECEDWNAYIKRFEKGIRETWFAKHVAELHTCKDCGITVLRWHEPGTNIFALRYTLHGCCLEVVGDLDEAVYRWSQPLTLDFLAHTGLDYFASKCRASADGVGGRHWYREKAMDSLKYHTSEHPLEDYDSIPLSSQHEYWQWLGDEGQKVFGDDYFEFGDIGEYPAPAIIGHHIGLKMAWEQLNQKHLSSS